MCVYIHIHTRKYTHIHTSDTIFWLDNVRRAVARLLFTLLVLPWFQVRDDGRPAAARLAVAKGGAASAARARHAESHDQLQ